MFLLFLPFLIFCQNDTSLNQVSIIKVYRLPFGFITSAQLNCNSIKSERYPHREYCTSNKKIIRQFRSLFNDKRNLLIQTAYNSISPLSLIELYSQDGELLGTICWSQTRMILFNDRVYSYSKPIEKLLLSIKAIYVIK